MPENISQNPHEQWYKQFIASFKTNPAINEKELAVTLALLQGISQQKDQNLERAAAVASSTLQSGSVHFFGETLSLSPADFKTTNYKDPKWGPLLGKAMMEMHLQARVHPKMMHGLSPNEQTQVAEISAAAMLEGLREKVIKSANV